MADGYQPNRPGPGGPGGPPNMDVQLKSGLDKLVAKQVITPKQEEFLIKFFHDMNDRNIPAVQPDVVINRRKIIKNYYRN
jgi:hypothetical protein